jgi:ankyrin repeat protein
MLPKGTNALDSTYDQVIERINAQNSDFKSLAEQTLSWITYAQRPLSLYELQHALAVEPNESELDEENIPHIELIVSVCAGLVTVDQESDVIRLVHYTTQEYFERTRSTLFPNAQKNIGRCCLTYLTYDVFSAGPCQSDQKFESRLRKFRLLEYAACYWANHIHGELEDSLEDLIFGFLMDEAKVACAVQVMLTPGYRYDGYSQKFARNVLGLHLCAYFGLERMTAKLLDYQLARHLRDSNGRTPLSWAARNGHGTVVEMLAARDDVDVDSKDRWGQTPLSLAAENGHEAVVEVLAARDDVNTDLKGDNGQSPLSWAARMGHETVVELLAARDDVDVDLKDNNDRTPLSWAAGNGYKAVVEVLAARDDVDADPKDRWGRTPLSWAARMGHETVVEMLAVRDDVEVDSKDNNHWTPLSWAASSGHETVVEMLAVRDDVDVDSKDKWGRTPLSLAAENGHETVVEILAARDDVDMDSKDDNGQSPLSWAVRRGYETVVELLAAQKYVDVDLKDNNDRTPLSWAAGNGYKAVVELLELHISRH